MSSSDDSDTGGCKSSLDLPLLSVEIDLEVQGNAAGYSAPQKLAQKQTSSLLDSRESFKKGLLGSESQTEFGTYRLSGIHL